MENIFSFQTLRFLHEGHKENNNNVAAFILKMVFIFVILIPIQMKELTDILSV